MLFILLSWFMFQRRHNIIRGGPGFFLPPLRVSLSDVTDGFGRGAAESGCSIALMKGVYLPAVCKNTDSAGIMTPLPIYALQNEAKLLRYFNACGLLAKSLSVLPTPRFIRL